MIHLVPPLTARASYPFLPRSLEALSALRGLRQLRVGCNPLACLAGVEALGRLTALGAAGAGLESLPSLAGLPSLRALDLAGNRLTPAALAAAGLHAGACPQLTSLQLPGNHALSELASWLGPQPCLLRLDISGCGLASLDGLAAAAPLLQVGAGWLPG
jgi:Leucine-rich repeat (LRR) protein